MKSVQPTGLAQFRRYIYAVLLPTSTSCHMTFWREYRRANRHDWSRLYLLKAASEDCYRGLNFNNWRWYVRKKTYDAVGQTQLGNNFECSCAESPPQCHSADLLQTEGGILIELKAEIRR